LLAYFALKVNPVKSPNVSVCVPVYNGEKYIESCIRSVLEQTYTDFEVIVQNDASTDHTLEIVTEIARTDSRVRVNNNASRLGIYANHNASFKNARGRFVKLLDQDDLLDPTSLEAQVAILDSQDDIALVGCARRVIDQDGKLLGVHGRSPEHGDGVVPASVALIQLLADYLNCVGEPCAVLFRNRHPQLWYDEKLKQLGEGEFWARHLLAGGNLYLMATPLCSYRIHPENCTMQNLQTLDYLADLVYVRKKHASTLVALGVSADDTRARLLANSYGVINYATHARGVDYSKASFQAAERRPLEIGELLVETLRALEISERDKSLAKEEALAARQSAAALQSQIAALQASKSWRMTSPLRKALSFWKSRLGARS
jgi:glycosyltransferase involved in cell wall biosynthesis